MDRPFAAYRGTDSYVFVCYAHADAETVYCDLASLNNSDVKLWYDEGIPAGTSWRAEIAAAIQGASKFLFFISKASLNSSHCLRELDFALNHDIEVIPVYLDDSALTPELQFVLNRVQALHRKSDSMYADHLLSAMRETSSLVTFFGARRKSQFRMLIPVLAIGAGLAVLMVWTQQDSVPAVVQNEATLSAAPNAIDRYLTGMTLVERWDKDDNLDNAIASFQEAVELDSGFALAYARLADALRMRAALARDQNWLDQADDHANRALSLNPDLAPVQMVVGRIHAARGNYDIAYATLQRALEIDPNDASTNHAIASVYERLGRQLDAEASLEKAVSLAPENLIVLDAYANFLFRQSRYPEAAVQWQTVVRMAPDHHAALLNLGTALNESGRVAEAVTMYQRAIEIRPTYMAFSNLGTAYGRAERYAEAESAYLAALEFDEADWLAWGNLGYIYSWTTGSEQQATQTFEQAIQLAEAARIENARDPFVHSDLALYYAKIRQEALAEQRITTALNLAPDAGEILAAAAEVYELIGQRDVAVEFVLKSFELGFPRQQLQRNPEFDDLLQDLRLQ